MALQAVSQLSEQPDDDGRREVSATPQSCPICEGGMEVVYARQNQQVLVCRDCHAGLTVPSTAWEVVRIKTQTKWMPNP